MDALAEFHSNLINLHMAGKPGESLFSRGLGVLSFPMRHAGSAFSCHFSALGFVPDSNLAAVCQAKRSRLEAQASAPSRGEGRRGGAGLTAYFPHTDQNIKMGKLEGRLGFL